MISSMNYKDHGGGGEFGIGDIHHFQDELRDIILSKKRGR
jgi:hypothetical protein